MAEYGGMKRIIGPVTGAATVGGGLGAALAQIIVHLAPSFSEVESAVTVVLTVGLALVGGYIVPPQGRQRWDHIMEDADGYGSDPSADDGETAAYNEADDASELGK